MLRKPLPRGSSAGTARCGPPIECEGTIHAVGDIHGRHDLAARLVERILADAQQAGVRPRIVFLGDYIDRGEEARQTLDLLLALARGGEAETIFLRGNHEQMLLDFLADPLANRHWLNFGGLATLLSYGVSVPPGPLHREEAARGLGDALRDALGEHLCFIERLAPSYREGNLFFSHAGADPRLPLDAQTAESLLWGCQRLHAEGRSDGNWIIYGHFVVDEPIAAGGRIAIDTGAYFSGRLTAAAISRSGVRFLQS